MRLAFFVNDIEREYENYTTTVLAHRAIRRQGGLASRDERDVGAGAPHVERDQIGGAREPGDGNLP